MFKSNQKYSNIPLHPSIFDYSINIIILTDILIIIIKSLNTTNQCKKPSTMIISSNTSSLETHQLEKVPSSIDSSMIPLLPKAIQPWVSSLPPKKSLSEDIPSKYKYGIP